MSMIYLDPKNETCSQKQRNKIIVISNFLSRARMTATATFGAAMRTMLTNLTGSVASTIHVEPTALAIGIMAWSLMIASCTTRTG